MKSGIYKITFKNGKVYVGQTNSFPARWANHRKLLRDGTHTNAIMQNAWNKYGEASVSFDVVHLASGDLTDLEQKYIDEAVADGTCCNISLVAGIRRGWNHSPEVKEAARIRSTGVKASAETRSRQSAMQLLRLPASPEKKAEIARKISAAHTGKVVSDATRQKIREIRTGTTQTAESNAKRSATQTGQKRGPEYAAICSKAKILAYANSPEYRQKLSAAARIRGKDPEFIAMATKNLPNTSRPVVCSNGDVYPSIISASKATGVFKHTIARICRGQIQPTAGGLNFWPK